MGSKSTLPYAVCAITQWFPRSRYTGKERDTESGNDYFEARYYASSMGRFMYPDWASNPRAVPYATYANPTHDKDSSSIVTLAS